MFSLFFGFSLVISSYTLIFPLYPASKTASDEVMTSHIRSHVEY